MRCVLKIYGELRKREREREGGMENLWQKCIIEPNIKVGVHTYIVNEGG